MLTIIHFLTNIVDFQLSESLTEQTCDARLETWYEHSWKHIRDQEFHLIPLKPKIPCEK